MSVTNKRIGYHITRTYRRATVSSAEVAASLLYPWLGNEEAAPGGEKRGFMHAQSTARKAAARNNILALLAGA
jgi:hypothetical protein